MLRATIIAFSLMITAANSDIVSAKYDAPTTRYAHGVFGDAVEYGALLLKLKNGKSIRFVLPENRVFEDIAPRLSDLDGDGTAEVIVVETQVNKGAQLAVYDESGKITATPHIGRSHRWLAPVGAADLDGDGFIELAYIDRPHLAKLLKIWRFKDGKLEFITETGNLTNHRFGDDYISGGIRDCGTGPEVITASSDWSNIMISRLVGKTIKTQSVAPYAGPKSILRTLSCN